MTWVKGLSWGWTITLFPLHLRTLHSITMSPLIVHIYQNASQSGKPRTCHHQTALTMREPWCLSGKLRSNHLYWLCTHASTFQFLFTFKSHLKWGNGIGLVLSKKKKKIVHSSEDCKWTAYGLACFWSVPKKVLRELNVCEINVSLLSCPSPLE